MTPESTLDPVLVRRRRLATWTQRANRLGYLCFGVSLVTFFIGLAGSFNGVVATIVIGSIIVGSVLLAPALVLGYGIKAADRDDRERGL